MEINALVCPQCNSADVRVLSSKQAVCNSCGTILMVEQTTSQGRDAVTFSYAKLNPEFTTDQFLRAAWISLAEQDAPEDVFAEHFGDVTVRVCQAVVEKKALAASYRASIGYDRQESYLDYEKYYENEPYVDYETYYENGVRHQRQVTKYKKVERQRQVTKYKTVVDWNAMNGAHHMISHTVAANDCQLDISLFQNSMSGIRSESIVDVTSQEALQMVVTPATRESLDAEHLAALYNDVDRILPGDHHRDISVEVDQVKEQETAVFLVTEYEATIEYKGQTYVKRAYPYGAMPMGGNAISNKENLATAKEKMAKALEEYTEDRRKQAEERIWKMTKAFSLTTLVALAVSIGVSLLIPYIAAVVAAFAVAIGAVIVDNRRVSAAEEDQNTQAQTEIDRESQKTQEQIVNFHKHYLERRLELLNSKLSSLGFEPEEFLNIKREGLA